MWHKELNCDLKLTAASLRFATLVFHDHQLARSGDVHISLRTAADRLGVSVSTAQRARDQLVARGWLTRLDGPELGMGHYRLSPGPNSNTTIEYASVASTAE